MFVEICTLNGERVCVNVERVLCFSQTKKGVSVVLDDGTPIGVNEPFSSVMERFNRVVGVDRLVFEDNN